MDEPVVNDESESASNSSLGQPAKLVVRLLALDGEPIVKLGVNVRWSGGELTAFTDADGRIAPVQAPAGEVLTLAVQRFDKSYKEIGTSVMPATDGLLTAISPSLVVETTTEKHEGSAGTAKEAIPRPVQADAGDLQPAAPTGSTAGTSNENLPADPAQTPSKPVSKPTVAAEMPKSKPAAPAKQTATSSPQKISGASAQKDKPKPGRDEHGHPMAVFVNKAKDWWGSWRLPTLNLWGANAAQGTSAKAYVQVSASMEQQVKELLEFAKTQTEYWYKEGTAGVLESMAKRKFEHKANEKESSRSIGLCYTYVKVALAKSKIVDGVLGAKLSAAHQECASLAGAALTAKGVDFVDVTDSVPDARWAAAGDVIVYAWSDETWAKRKTEKQNDKLPNYGHIDIRDYETYISDHLPVSMHPRWFDTRKANKSG
ncbi:hypothetical protein [Uliginosibacterium sediminicola]|uniref:Uncharacterized protein n=1 Tax=Uliginosibacterium sediminicola TaxID=2024550 RepID=A0ABU9Z1E4_9RHOO